MFLRAFQDRTPFERELLAARCSQVYRVRNKKKKKIKVHITHEGLTGTTVHGWLCNPSFWDNGVVRRLEEGTPFRSLRMPFYGSNFKLLNSQKGSSSQSTQSCCGLSQRRLEPGKEGSRGFLQIYTQQSQQKMVLISFEDIQKISIFCFMHKGVAQNLSLPHPFEV